MGVHKYTFYYKTNKYYALYLAMRNRADEKVVIAGEKGELALEIMKKFLIKKIDDPTYEHVYDSEEIRKIVEYYEEYRPNL